jgi:hypothetical protein
MSTIRKLFETSVDDRVFQKAIEKPKIELKTEQKIDPYEHLTKREDLLNELRQSYIDVIILRKLVRVSKATKEPAPKIELDPKTVIEEMFRD